MKTPKDFRNLSVKTYVNAVLRGSLEKRKAKKKDWAPSNKQSDEILCNSRARDEAFVSGAFVEKGTDHFPRQTFQLVPGTGFNRQLTRTIDIVMGNPLRLSTSKNWRRMNRGKNATSQQRKRTTE